MLRLDIGMNTTFLKNGRMVLGILFVLGCCACSDESVPAGKVTEESVYDRMGRLHNEGLDYVLERISEEGHGNFRRQKKSGICATILPVCADMSVRPGQGPAVKCPMIFLFSPLRSRNGSVV